VRLASAVESALEKASASAAQNREREEKERLEAERREREEKERSDVLRRESEEKERLEADRRQREEEERLDAEQRERDGKERLEAERRQREKKERLEAERREREEKERFDAPRREREEKERLEAERREHELTDSQPHTVTVPSQQAPEPAVRKVEAPTGAAAVAAHVSPDGTNPQPTPPSSLGLGRRTAAAIGLVLGALIGLGALATIRTGPTEYIFFCLSTGVAGAIAGAALVRESRLAVALVAGITAIAWTGGFFSWNQRNEAFATATIIFAPIAITIASLFLFLVRRSQRS
jgi:hypothetical protein